MTQSEVKIICKFSLLLTILTIRCIQFCFVWDDPLVSLSCFTCDVDYWQSVTFFPSSFPPYSYNSIGLAFKNHYWRKPGMRAPPNMAQ